MLVLLVLQLYITKTSYYIQENDAHISTVRVMYVNYNLRTRLHNKTLIPKTSDLNERDF